MIEVDDLHVVFNAGTALENHVLRGVSLSIPKHQFITVIGSNGAGKSTLLNVIAGETAVSGGAVRIEGQGITGWPVPERAAVITRVFQDPLAGTCADLSIEENMAIALARGKRRGLGHALTVPRRERIREALSRLGLGLENRLHDSMGLLSGGQRQAISLLMASLTDSKLLLLDEHTAALDPRTSDFVMKLTDDLVRELKLTVLMVTHSMRQALDHGDRTIMLHQGRIVFDIAGHERSQLDVPDLLALFSQRSGKELSDDSLLLG
ncbi:ABC transporter ATP-binding protein [Variovorax sp. M-6]|uniref:ABC transporter ATP-binding protein n=1 Tax=Variovorax sp. M-6 TaxID=3233041 RepID=UPI003F9E15C4